MSSDNFTATVDQTSGETAFLVLVSLADQDSVTPSLIVMLLQNLASEVWLPAFDALMAEVDATDLEAIVAVAPRIVRSITEVTGRREVHDGVEIGVRVEFTSRELADDLPLGREWGSVGFDAEGYIARARNGRGAPPLGAVPEPSPRLPAFDEATFADRLEARAGTGWEGGALAACRASGQLLAERVRELGRVALPGIATFTRLERAPRRQALSPRGTVRLRFNPGWAGARYRGPLRALPLDSAPPIWGRPAVEVIGVIFELVSDALADGHCSVDVSGVGTFSRRPGKRGEPRDRFEPAPAFLAVAWPSAP